MRISAFAKINLTLEVTGVEPNGYHTLDTLFTWLELDDTLDFEASTKTSLEIVSQGVPIDSVREDESNLVIKALRTVESTVGRELPTRIRLTKRIPAGGGLGGGSSDAAATLIALNTLYSLGLDQAALLDLARPLGADVAFGLVGGLARGTRYGDLLTPANSSFASQDHQVVLVMPPFSCSTPEVFALWDQCPTNTAKGSTDSFLASDDLLVQYSLLSNDLEAPAVLLRPQLAEFKQAMVSSGLQGVCLSGSGSTLFGFLPSSAALEQVERALANSGARVMATKIREGSRFECVS